MWKSCLHGCSVRLCAWLSYGRQEPSEQAVAETITNALDHIKTCHVYLNGCISRIVHALTGRPLFLFSLVFFVRFSPGVESALRASTCTFENLLLASSGLWKHTCSFSALSCIFSFSSRAEHTWELLQLLWTLSNSAGAVPSTDALFKGICCGRRECVRWFFFPNSRTLYFIFIGSLLQSLGSCNAA